MTRLLLRKANPDDSEFAYFAKRSAFRECVENSSEWALVSTEGSTVVGVCHGAPEWDFERDEAVPGVAHLTGLFVEPRVWGRGYGRALLLSAQKLMRKRGFERSRLWVAEGNDRARRLYESEGWRLTGRTGSASDGLILIEYEAALPSPSSGRKALR